MRAKLAVIREQRTVNRSNITVLGSLFSVHQDFMKQNIHPPYFQDAKIICACGKVHNIPSTVKEMHVELCSNCHPYYTGTAKLVDTARRIDKFRARVAKGQAVQAARLKPKNKKAIMEPMKGAA